MITELRRIGPRPWLMARYVTHQGNRRIQRFRVSRRYARTIGSASTRASLQLIELDLPPLDELPKELVPAGQSVCDEARCIADHVVDYLGSGLTAVGWPIPWHTDFKSGYTWPLEDYDRLAVTRLDDDSDAKVPWELSRGHQLLTLARAAALTKDPIYATECVRQLRDWITRNPAGKGINWATPMEVGIRAVNWVWALSTLRSAGFCDDGIEGTVADALVRHALHIEANFEGSPFLRSNHYLGNLLGVLAVGSVLPDDARSRRWVRRAAKELERQIRNQVLDDGVDFEASLPYHGLCLEMFLVGDILMRHAGLLPSEEYRRRLSQMLDVSHAVRHPGGLVPQFGDNDSGRILPAGFARPVTHDHLLALGGALYGRELPADLTREAEAAWVLGVRAWSRMSAAPRAPARAGLTSFPHGGIYVLDAGAAHVVVRCGDVGQNGNGGHAHNDIGSFEVSWYGSPVVVDSGTYAYTFDLESRDAFRSTAAHNVACVDELEQNPIDPARPFQLRGVAQPAVTAVHDRVEGISIVMEHRGYTRSGSGPVLSRRTVTLSRDGRDLTIHDSLTGSGDHRVRLLFHLDPAVRIVQAGNEVVDLETPTTRLIAQFSGAQSLTTEACWISPAYGRRESSRRLVAGATGPVPREFQVTLRVQ